ncbi:MAG: hypothetical protein AB7V10_07960 [Leucobacter sp.]
MKMYVPILSALEQSIQTGMREGLEAVLEYSNELAPEDEGGIVEGGEVRVDDLTGQVSYKTKKGFPYEVLQHENLELQHPDGGQAKFLETAAAEIDVSEFIANQVRADFGG